MIFGLAMLVSLAASTSSASDTEQNEFMQLFAVTCMANVYTPERLRETLATPLTPELPPERAAPLLAGRPGTAWEVFFGEGQYAVSLTESHCAVFARQAPVASVHDAFAAFVSTAPPPLRSEKRSPEEAGPNSNDLRSVAYVWSRPGDAQAIVFTLTTSNSAKAPEIQAMASVARARQEP